MDEHLLISVIILTYNRAELLPDLLSSVTSQVTENLFNYEILLVNDSSTDDTASVLECYSQRPGIRVLQGLGTGPAGARNIGISAARGGWVAFLDDDEIPSPDWLFELYMTAFETRADIVAGARELHICPPPLTKLDPYCRELLGEELWYTERTMLSKYRYPNTGNVLLSRRVFTAVGTFDESPISSSFGGEDVDLMMRARRAGIQQWFAPGAKVAHITPRARTLSRALFRCAMRQGCGAACSDRKFFGVHRVVLLCFLRAGVSIFRDLWDLTLLRPFRSPAVVQARICRLSRTAGYLLAALGQLEPRFVGRAVRNRCGFRKSRRTVEMAAPTR